MANRRFSGKNVAGNSIPASFGAAANGGRVYFAADHWPEKLDWQRSRAAFFTSPSYLRGGLP